ncbi:MAG: hypothetical protein Q8P84_07455 [Deltaproteobacteria bacterium]|nr:hypothetical protein [Deltaproteobacteria bacterium]
MTEYRIHTIRIHDAKPKGFGPEDACIEPKEHCIEQLAKDGYVFISESLEKARQGKIRIPLQTLAEYVEEMERWRQKIAAKEIPAHKMQMGIQGLKDWGKAMDPAMAQSASFRIFFTNIVAGTIELSVYHHRKEVAAQKIKMPPPFGNIHGSARFHIFLL